MKILSSQVAMGASSQYRAKKTVKNESLQVRSGQRQSLSEDEAAWKLEAGNAGSITQSVDVSEMIYSQTSALVFQDDNGQDGKKNNGQNKNKAEERADRHERMLSSEVTGGFAVRDLAERVEVKTPEQLRMELLERLLNSIFDKNKRLKFTSFWDRFDADMKKQRETSGTMIGAMQTAANFAGFVSNIQRTTVEVAESETMAFAATAAVKTADGRSINVKMAFEVSRSFYAKMDSTSVSESFQQLVDPLVINFDANSAALTDMKFSFDLDADGQSDQISSLAKGSGFLMMDLYNGEIRDGKQLFGTQSGNGFADLAAHDKDANGWIDEGDAVYDKLRIWTKDENGGDRLIALGEAGIGAIYLGYANTEFSMKSDSGLNGVIQKTGLFLREDGSAGSVQHVDFAV